MLALWRRRSGAVGAVGVDELFKVE